MAFSLEVDGPIHAPISLTYRTTPFDRDSGVAFDPTELRVIFKAPSGSFTEYEKSDFVQNGTEFTASHTFDEEGDWEVFEQAFDGQGKVYTNRATVPVD